MKLRGHIGARGLGVPPEGGIFGGMPYGLDNILRFEIVEPIYLFVLLDLS